MNRYDPTNFRSNIASAVFALMLSATCLLTVIGPAYAASLTDTATACPAPVTLPLA